MRLIPLFILSVAGPLLAQEATPSPSPSQSEIAENTAAVRDLAKKVEALTRALEAAQIPKAQPAAPATAGVSTPASSAGNTAADGTAQPAIPVATAVAAGRTHTVQKGETLTVIAKQYGVTVEDISKANQIQDARKLQAGQELIIPTPVQPEPKRE